MANTTSAKKATRKIARRTAVNKARRSRVRGFIRKVEEAIASGDLAVATEALKASTLVMKLIDACRERIFSRKSNLHFLVANDESYALAA